MNNLLLKVKNQQLRILGFVFLVIGILIFVQAILFVFEIKGQLMVPLHLFSVQSSLYPAQFFQLLNVVAWLALIFFVCITGILIMLKGIALLKLHQDMLFAAKIDRDEIEYVCKNYEEYYS